MLLKTLVIDVPQRNASGHTYVQQAKFHRNTRVPVEDSGRSPVVTCRRHKVSSLACAECHPREDESGLPVGHSHGQESTMALVSNKVSISSGSTKALSTDAVRRHISLQNSPCTVGAMGCHTIDGSYVHTLNCLRVQMQCTPLTLATDVPLTFPRHSMIALQLHE